MKNPPAATAAVAVHDPVRAAVPAQAMAVVTRWPPGLMSPLSRNARAAAPTPVRGRAARAGCAAACPEWGADFRSDHACYILAFRSDFPEEETGVGVCPGGDLCGAHRRVRSRLSRDRAAAAPKSAGHREADELRVRRRAHRPRLGPLSGGLLPGRPRLHRVR